VAEGEVAQSSVNMSKFDLVEKCKCMQIGWFGLAAEVTALQLRRQKTAKLDKVEMSDSLRSRGRGKKGKDRKKEEKRERVSNTCGKLDQIPKYGQSTIERREERVVRDVT
jgi:hypothetical protein